ncbi:inositol oxygenase-like isoform X2 [Lytechinus pictus]|uniref:inositol oxygenase-like isoform X2 n=1 Tax=Lytechinus pictus TaxID=7653 RepID=UPI00240E19FF|nr:inositol oxygenase-like [Lytechinus pictus]
MENKDNKVDQVLIMDPSLVYRPDISDEEKKYLGLTDISQETEFTPGKDEADFRRFDDDDSNATMAQVKKTYYLMHTNQTYDYVMKQHEKWLSFTLGEMTVMEALDLLNSLIDESDPDTDLPNIYHAFQTAERIREKHPDKDWFHLIGLIHDMGKIMAMHGQPQFSTVGDTFVVGCLPPESLPYGLKSFTDNPDLQDPRYNTRLGIYKENCGLSNVTMSWGHDEYLYHVLNKNKTTLPEEGLYMVRFHSFYPWHRGNEYTFLTDNKDREMLKWIHEFNKFDLYSKSDSVPNIDALRPYYQSLIDKYLPGKLTW